MAIAGIALGWILVGLFLSRAAWATDVAPLPASITTAEASRLERRRRIHGTEGRSGFFLLAAFAPNAVFYVLIWPLLLVILLVISVGRPTALRRFAYSVVHARLPEAPR